MKKGNMVKNGYRQNISTGKIVKNRSYCLASSAQYKELGQETRVYIGNSETDSYRKADSRTGPYLSPFLIRVV